MRNVRMVTGEEYIHEHMVTGEEYIHEECTRD